MNFPISQEYINRILLEQDIDDISNATIRQCAGIAEKIEEDTGEKFVHLELGIPGVEECPIGTKAQKEALDSGVASKYPPISGVKALKQSGSEFIKAFINVDIKPECVVPTVGGMQGSYNLFLECSQMTPSKDTILFINPGFPANYTQIKVLGIKSVSFDIYSFRAEKLRPKLEEILSQGNVSAIIYSNPNNPAWICLTESELKDIGECATKYDVIVLEDMAYPAYLGYQGVRGPSWQMTGCWYDAEKNFLCSETIYQYRVVPIPAGAAFLRISVAIPDPAEAHKARLTATLFFIPRNCAVRRCTFDRCRCVGYAASAMKNMLFEDNLFTRSGESSAKCAFDAEDGWDMMQDVTFRGNLSLFRVLLSFVHQNK